ncbi:MAG: hypothetical protein R2746_02975 [Acidimicrobiales bacterium]|nr:hypothetical protein [Actinomycetota bacterium]
MTTSTVLAYLDAGSGAALAAVVASGAVGARVVVSNVAAKFRRRSARPDQPADAPEGGAGAPQEP